MNLSCKIKKIKTDHAECGYNGIVDAFSLFVCEMIDTAADNNEPFAKTTVKNILKMLKKYTGGYTDQLKGAYEQYAECAIFLEIKSKNILIEKIKESREKSPDFKISLNNKNIYAEAKVLNWKNGQRGIERAMKDSKNAKIDADKQIQEGKSIAFSETEISPLGKTEGSYENPQKYFIEKVCEKLGNNIKEEQINQGPTFLICDLTSLKHPSCPQKSSVIVHNKNLYNAFSSGELWHIAFGKCGDKIPKPITFEGEAFVSEALTRDGILTRYNEHKDIKLIGIIFRISGLDNTLSYSCLIKSENYDKYSDFIHQLGCCWNDDKNSNARVLLRDE